MAKKKGRPRRRPERSTGASGAVLWKKLAADELIVQSRGHLQRVEVARIAFVNHFMKDPRVVAFLSFQVAEVEPQARVAAATLDALAIRRGLEHRGQLFADDVELDAEIRAIVQQQYESVVDSAAIDTLAMAALGLLMTLGLRWPWLVSKIVMQFEATIDGFLTGRTMQLETWAELFAPVVDMHFKTARKETLSAARARLSDLYMRAVAKLDASAGEQAGRGPKQHDDYLEVASGWLYRHRLRGETIASLAAQCGTGRTTVQSGIKNVDRLLSSTTLQPAPFK